MLSVDVHGNLELAWMPPTTNVDGSTLDDLTSYRIYGGNAAGNYTDQVQIDDPTARSYSLSVPQGGYYVAMTATNSEGAESVDSNELYKVVSAP
ncbi:MAG: hypothetical protein O3A63_18105 [Proteobacteria bacterium]|nr:hypothetical protein [Pseudomonadota bacterium]